MSGTPTYRIASVLALLLALFALSVWLGSLQPAPELGDFPDTTDLAADYDGYLGDHAEVGGTVVETDPVTIVSETDRPVRLVVTDLAVRPDRGDNLRVFGVVEPDHTVRATNAFVVPPIGHVYTYGISFFAGLWVLGRVLARWRLDEDWALARRDAPRSILSLARRVAGKRSADAGADPE